MDHDILLLSGALGILSLGILALGTDILASSRRRAALAAAPQDELRAFLRAAPPMRAQPAMPEPEPGKPASLGPLTFEPSLVLEPPTALKLAPAQAEAQAADGFVFRRHVSRDFASMELSHKRFRPAPEPENPPPAPLDFSTIQSEVRAALGAAAPAFPPPIPHGAQLTWTEPGRLAVLSLAGAPAEAGLALLRDHGVATLIAASGHPFRLPVEGIDILSLPHGSGAAALTTRLRAKLADGGRIAFHTESGLSGAAAQLAARFSSRQAG